MKEIIKKEEVTEKIVVGHKDVIKYEAIDGTIFDYKSVCEEYELNYLWHRVSLTKKTLFDSFDDNAYYLCNNFDELNALFYHESNGITLEKFYSKKKLKNIKHEVFPQYFAIDCTVTVTTPEKEIEILNIELEKCIKNYNKAIDGLKEIDLVNAQNVKMEN